MTQALIAFYQTVSTTAIALGVAGFAATFTFNNFIAHLRSNLYESGAYATVAKKIESIDPTLDAARPLRVLVWLTNTVRFVGLGLALYVVAVPKNHWWTATIGLVLFLAWLILMVLWLISIHHHHKYENELTSRKLTERRDATKIDPGLDPR